MTDTNINQNLENPARNNVLSYFRLGDISNNIQEHSSENLLDDFGLSNHIHRNQNKKRGDDGSSS